MELVDPPDHALLENLDRHVYIRLAGYGFTYCRSPIELSGSVPFQTETLTYLHGGLRVQFFPRTTRALLWRSGMTK